VDIVAWLAHVRGDGPGHRAGAYSVRFQVWRPSPTVQTDGCYSMVGENVFSNIIIGEDRSINVNPEPSNIISARPGDVLGYYTISNRNINDGIQLHEDLNNEEVWYHTNNDEDSLMFRGMECPFPVGLNGVLTASTSLGPIISPMLGKSRCKLLNESLILVRPNTSGRLHSLHMHSTTFFSPIISSIEMAYEKLGG